MSVENKKINDKNRPLRVLFLYSNERSSAYRDIVEGKNHPGGFWGMFGLDAYEIDASFLEIEQVFPLWFTRFLRKHINVYFIHLCLFFKILRYDIVYTSAAFGTQLLHTLYPFKKPKWVMHDFSIMSMIGERKTIKQKIFYFMVSRCAGIVTLGEEEAVRLKGMFPHMKENISCIPFGADLSFFKPIQAKKTDSIIAVGRDPDRDWGTLVSIAPSIEAEFVIATRENRIAHLRPLPENVRTGQFPVEELMRLYDEAKVFVLPLDTSKGINDAMGCSALYEALAMGKAIVATNTHTMRSYITDGDNGLLVPEKDAEALRAAIVRVLENDVLREKLQHSARAYAETHLEINTQTKILASYFYSL